MGFNCEEFNKKIINLWNEYKNDETWKESTKFMPCLLGDLYQNRFLFIGFNASMTGDKGQIEDKGESCRYFENIDHSNELKKSDEGMKKAKEESPYHKQNQVKIALTSLIKLFRRT